MHIVTWRRSTNAQMDTSTEPPADSTRLGVILAASVSLGISLMVCLRVLCLQGCKRVRRVRLPFFSANCSSLPDSPREAVADQPAAGTSVV